MAKFSQREQKALELMQGNLVKLGNRIVSKGRSASVRAGGSVIIKAMRSRAPVETGSLKKALGQRIKTYRRSGTSTSIIGARSKLYATAKGKRNPANYAHLPELGVRPHRIPRKGTKGIWHTGVEGKPYMRPAWDSAASDAKDAVVDKLSSVFNKEAKKLQVQ